MGRAAWEERRGGVLCKQFVGGLRRRFTGTVLERLQRMRSSEKIRTYCQGWKPSRAVESEAQREGRFSQFGEEFGPEQLN